MVGLIQLALLALFVAVACGSDSCSWPGHDQLAGVGLFQHFQRRHTAASPAAGPSIPSAHVQPAHIDIVGNAEPLRVAAVHRQPVAPQSAAAQVPDAAPKELIAGASQVTQQEARSGMRSLADTTKQEMNQDVTLQRSNTPIKVDQKVGLINMDQRTQLNTNYSIHAGLTAQAPRSTKVHDSWSKKTLIDSVCVIGALVIIFLFLVLADVI